MTAVDVRLIFVHQRWLIFAIVKPDKVLGVPRILSGFYVEKRKDVCMSNSQNFTEGKILPALLKFAFPVLMALLLQDNIH